jgi:PAS domain S-box-containing protein
MSESPTHRLTTLSPADQPPAPSLFPGIELILDAIPGGCVGLDAEGRTALVNETASRLLGWSAEELVGRPFHDVVHHHRANGAEYPAADCPILNALATGQNRRIESDLFWRKDGAGLPVECECRPIRRQGHVVGALVAFHDRTDRERADERTRQLVREQFARAKAEFQHAQLRDILGQAPALICVTRGPRHVIDTVNDLYQRSIGERIVVGKAMRDAIPDLPAGHLAALDRTFETGVALTGTEVPGARLLGEPGNGLFFTFVVQPLRDDTGTIYGLMTHAVDVTGHVRARTELEQRSAELQKTTERLSLAAEAGHLGAWEWEVTTGRVVWSPELERIHGLAPGTFPGTFEAYQSDIHPEDRERVLRTISETVQHRRPHVLEYRIVPPDGGIRWVEARGRMFFDHRGEPDRLVGICMDITDRKHAEQELASQHRLAELMADVGMILTRSDELPVVLQACAESVVRHGNAAFARIWTLDASRETLELRASAGMYTHLDGAHSRVPVGQFKIGRIAAERRPHLTNDVVGDAGVSDQEWARREGMKAFAGYPLLAGDELLGVLAIFARHPLTTADLQALGAVAHSVAVGLQKKRHKEALRRSEQHLRGRAEELTRLAAALERSNRELDAFAYAASHDLRAPLRGIANLAQWIEEDLTAQGGLKSETAEMLQLMRGRMHRMEALIDGLLQYSRAGRTHKTPEAVDIHALVAEVVDLLAPPAGATVTLEPLPAITTERLPLQQVFMNLIGNALKHGGGDRAVIVVGGRDAGAFHEFFVRDNGPGIAPEFQDRIWGIFQTLEARDKVEGTGIGLALVKKIVEGHGGRVWVESSVGQGSTFRFLWPR